MSLFQGFIQLGAGLSVGLAGLAAGFAIGIVGDAGVRGTAQQPRLFVGMVRKSARKWTRLLTLWNAQILILIFAEVLGLYGLIVALIMNTKADGVSVVRPPHNSKLDSVYSFLGSATNGREKSKNGRNIRIMRDFCLCFVFTICSCFRPSVIRACVAANADVFAFL